MQAAEAGTKRVEVLQQVLAKSVFDQLLEFDREHVDEYGPLRPFYSPDIQIDYDTAVSI